jgi:mannose-6-phosphate isomerase-like protein (cupin superfamily)
MQDVAYSRLAIETREVKNASFKYAKMLSMPFFGTGIVDVPPGGVKRSKNSRKMHMCFFVYSGRVIVEVAGNKFGLAKGGLWQVPRGTLYFHFEISGTCFLFAPALSLPTERLGIATIRYGWPIARPVPRLSPCKQRGGTGCSG